jgi:hypothetical protein
MTPKEKAQELFDKYWLYTDKSMAKKYALITVDEVLNIEKKIWDGFHSEYFYWWEEVKQEIEAL